MRCGRGRRGWRGVDERRDNEDETWLRVLVRERRVAGVRAR